MKLQRLPLVTLTKLDAQYLIQDSPKVKKNYVGLRRKVEVLTLAT